MASVKNILLRCPVCGENMEVSVRDLINGSFEPELTEQIMNGDLFKGVCKSCGLAIEFSYNFKFIGESFTIYCCMNRESMESALDSIRDSRRKDREYRVVSSLSELAEKIFIFRNNLDDRFVEIMKLKIAAELQKETGIKAARIRFEPDEDDSPAFVIWSDDGERGELPFNIFGYREIVDAFEGTVDAAEKKYEIYKVSEDYAKAVVKATFG